VARAREPEALWYLGHQSLVVDFLIRARTIPLLFRGVGR
jgi:hypothetical protein